MDIPSKLFFFSLASAQLEHPPQLRAPQFLLRTAAHQLQITLNQSPPAFQQKRDLAGIETLPF
jgi:hypothetical protein